MSALQTTLTRAFKLRHPVVLAPMGGASGARLAAAVSNAGGLGLVGASYGDEAWMQAQLPAMRDVREPWGVGLVMFTVVKQMRVLELALSYHPDVIALSFGDPRPFIPLIHERGAKAIVQVHEPDQARQALDAGADALIVQGAEAGGHSLERGLMALLPVVRDLVPADYPLIAAGGIADGRGLAAALALGADGAMLGTRMLATEEALPSAAYKRKLIESATAQTIRTRIFDLVRGIDWPASYSGRALANQFSARWLGRDEALRQAPAAVGEAFARAVREDDLEQRVIWAGEVLDLVNDIRPAGQLVHSLVEQTVERLQHVQLSTRLDGETGL